MSEPKWTPGPWKMSTPPSGGFAWIDQAAETDVSGFIATVWSAADDNRSAEVDGRLIAVAPELYAMVDRLADLLKQWCGDSETETGWKSDELAAVYIEAVDLLRKARGESA